MPAAIVNIDVNTESAVSECAPPHQLPRMLPLGVRAYTVSTAAGIGKQAAWQAIMQDTSGLRANDLEHCHLDTFIGRVAGLETQPLPTELAAWECRNNRLAWLALNQDGFLTQARQVIAQYGANRVALVLGTSTASMASTEEAYRHFDAAHGFPDTYRNQQVHAPDSLTGFVAAVLGITGPRFTVATACSSSARVFGSAERLIRAGVVDAAIVGGVDSLCLSVMYGFHALELMDSTRCRPFDQHRSGLNIGEAGGFAILERTALERDTHPLQLAGYGETSDAFHMSSPHPEGLGAQQAMQAALARAGMQSTQVDYINLHGTATRMNDAIEAHAVRSVFTSPVACSSTKGWTGHTLGAAGIVEAAFSLLALEHQCAPRSLHCQQPEADAQEYVLTTHRHGVLNAVMSNSFGFGGNNCALLFARADAMQKRPLQVQQ